MQNHDKVNILLVDDQPAKLLSYEVILRDLDENLIKTASAKEALEVLLRNEIAVVLVDVCMPDLDGFELAAMIRDHPRFRQTAIIFISAVLLTDTDHLRGYEMGAVDYVPVPVQPEVLRAKVRVFAELFRKTRQLEKLNQELEHRVAERTAELEASYVRLRESERRRSVALAAGQMGSWEWDVTTGECVWDGGQYRIFGVDDGSFEPNIDNVRPFVHPDDMERVQGFIATAGERQTFQTEVRIIRPTGEVRWCICAAAMTLDAQDHVIRVSGVTIDITDRKQAEERQTLLAREVDHRARNALAIVQAIVRLTHASSPQSYVAAVEGRIRALAQAHTLLSQSRWHGADVARLVGEELEPYRSSNNNNSSSSSKSPSIQVGGASIFLAPDKAQILALAVHELATNSVKYGALSCGTGELNVSWEVEQNALTLRWREAGGPPVQPPTVMGFGTKIMNASIKNQIGGDVVLDWRPTGLHCTLSLPFESGKADDTAGKASQKTNGAKQSPPDHRKRVLLVEDESLVGMMMSDVLSDLGLSVSGPFCSVMEAMSALASQEFDCAVLDLNLRGEPVYPVAMALAAQHIPFVFTTGYGSESIDKRFAHVPVLQKPIAREILEQVIRGQVGPMAMPDGGDHDGGRATIRA